MSSTADLPSGATAQSFGASVAYLRRYALQSMLGVSGDADADDDGEAERAKTEKPAKPAKRLASSASPVIPSESRQLPPTTGDVFVVLKVSTGSTASGTVCAQVLLGVPDVPDEITAYCWHKNLAYRLSTMISQRVKLVLVQRQREGKTIDLIEEMLP
jgi:hypothetical protein